MSRCKPGDLCVAVRGRNVGKSVTVRRLATVSEIAEVFKGESGVQFVVIDEGLYWLVDAPMNWGIGSSRNTMCRIPYCRDEFLLPITPPTSMVRGVKEQELVQ